MFTKNWHPEHLIAHALGFNNSAPGTTPTIAYNGSETSVTSILDMSPSSIYGLLTKFPGRKLDIFSTASSNSSSWDGVYFGDGTAASTIDDINFSGNIHTWISSSNTTTERSSLFEDNGDCVITTVYTINNNSGSDQTISEIGLGQTARCRTSSSSNVNYTGVLIERTLLETPITIAAGGVGKVTYTLRLSGLPTT